MKKYHQLLLLIVSAVSLTLFLIYRHEYNRLHYVLEVFNFFGHPCNFSELQRADFVVNRYDWGPQPIWQELDNGYVYSAFLTTNNEVKAIALQNVEGNVPRSCFLWFEDKKKPVQGKFKASKISGDKSIAYFYSCSALNLDNALFAVSFSYKLGRDSDLKKILLTDISSSNLRKNITVCISPSTFSKNRFVEFLSFHKVIGVDSFVFYGGDVPHRLSKLLTNLSQNIEMQVAFLPWNYPKRDTGLARVIVENDCLLRTFRRSRYVITLETNEYLLPKISLQSLFYEVPENTRKLTLAVKKICATNLSPSKPIALQNYDAISDSNYNVVRNFFRNDNDSLADKTIVQGQASIHKYVRCNTAHPKTNKDYSMNKYSSDLTRSTLVQLQLHGQL